MKEITLYYKGSLRYVLFKIEGKNYLLDRRPSHFIGYFFLPLNWRFYQKVYVITDEECTRLETRQSKASKFVIPTSLLGGFAVFFNTWLRVHGIDLYSRFNMELPNLIKISLLILGFILSYFSMQFLYFSSRKSVEKMFDNELGIPLYYKVQPEQPIRYFFNILGVRIFGIGLTTVFIVVFMYLGNIAFLFGTILALVLYLGSVNVAFIPEEKWRYKIIDAKY